MNARRPRLLCLAASAAIAAFLFTIAASAAPQLHARLHNGVGDSHTCAVTLLSSGSFDHVITAPLSLRPADAIEQPASVQDRSFAITRGLEFSLLEHAPPALS